ncbi:MAG: 50S ribosomal protein L23 [Flavobacteriales bacterium]|jgi:large subunit ribosomal protein L23|uniref:50S ribosomal protein L23 n=1 Tax=Blattabacterium sp. (Mastotermes darwiniensis) TaxID=39768 RepID=UPI000231DE71|nr:50S ribosomal protein L23 [Blattabacterium sp. (Mastotermes darwiniensis)]AER40677.1 50S ribosomal protein L23 [Blattabacterium sp. (Mastotermes darwiniensis) str. MADAR]MDR1804795.1 50S ribosomal protein L23 [Flavobacteriales bacterium]
MILIKPFITEKYSIKEKDSYYVFSVCINSNKQQIKKEISDIFGVSVKSIRTMISCRKDKSKYTKKGFLYGKTNRLKKAIVQLKDNQKIDYFKR